MCFVFNAESSERISENEVVFGASVTTVRPKAV